MPDENALPTRVRVLEVRFDDMKQDVTEIKNDLQTFHGDWDDSRKGLTRSEKIALTGAGSAVVAAIIAAAALISGSAG